MGKFTTVVEQLANILKADIVMLGWPELDIMHVWAVHGMPVGHGLHVHWAWLADAEGAVPCYLSSYAESLP